MAKKRRNPEPHGQTPLRSHTAITLRQEAIGLKPTALKGAGVAHDPESMLKLELRTVLHSPMVKVLFPRWLRSSAGIWLPDGKLWQFNPILLSLLAKGLSFGKIKCFILSQKRVKQTNFGGAIDSVGCETILQQGYNCIVHIEKTRAMKPRHSQKHRTPTQNSVVYSCQFCLRRNLKRATPKGHMKELHPAKARPISQGKSEKALQTSNNLEIETACGDESRNISDPSFSASEAVSSNDKLSSPVTKRSLELLSESKRRKQNRSATKKSAESEGGSANAEPSVGSPKKRRRKSWTTLKEIAERSENGVGKNILNLKIRFLI